MSVLVYEPGIIAWCVMNLSTAEADELADVTQGTGILSCVEVSRWLDEHRPDLTESATPENCSRAIHAWIEFGKAKL